MALRGHKWLGHLLASWLVGCASTDIGPEHYLDPETAVTVTSMSRPWVYARDEPALAAHARDYLNVGLLEVNRAGERRYWLVVTEWSTIDRSSVTLPPRPPTERLRLELRDGDPIGLATERRGRRAAGTSRAYFEPPGAARPRATWFALSVPQMTALAVEPPSAVVIEDVSGGEWPFATWDVDPALARALVADTAPPTLDQANRPRP